MINNNAKNIKCNILPVELYCKPRYSWGASLIFWAHSSLRHLVSSGEALDLGVVHLWGTVPVCRCVFLLLHVIRCWATYIKKKKLFFFNIYVLQSFLNNFVVVLIKQRRSALISFWVCSVLDCHISPPFTLGNLYEWNVFWGC